MTSFLNELTIEKAHLGLARKEFTAQELTEACLKRIKEVEEKIGAFLILDEEGAREAAKEVDRRISAGLIPGPLEGIPVAIKDNILVRGLKATAASLILENYQAVYDATVVKKLKSAGAIILGKTNLDEFAMGSSTETSAFHLTHHPLNHKLVPGGSSGGSAAAVAAHECIYALGSDTGGSIRQPASLCGVVGLKPTYGAVSRYGLIAMASSFDVIGPLTKTVRDARLVFEVIKGKDEKDATSREIEEEFNERDELKIENLRLGIPKEYFIEEGIDLGTEKLVREAIHRFKEMGAQVMEVSLPHISYALAVYYILMSAEVSTNLARYDGIKYGYSEIKNYPARIKSLYELYAQSRAHGFGDEVKRRIMMGTYVLSAGYREAYYRKAQEVRALIKNDFERAFKKVDCLISPTSPTPAWSIGERLDNPLTMYLSDIFTISANLVGIPALSFPCGRDNGLPVGLQLMAPQGKEDRLFFLGELWEKYDSLSSS
jgi:aspartyl-tRNA(Asn)/glutamyl-tRNA(Gln) amidotransferase subunit A